MDADDYFIGLRRSSSEDINDLIRKQTKRETTIEQFFIDIDQLDTGFNEKSARSFDAIKEPLDIFCCDDRLQEILLHFERNVVERFLENYVKGVR